MFPRLVFLSILFSLYAAVVSSQAIYHGHVQDAATAESLYNVEVFLLHSDQQTSTNYFGDFLLKNTAVDAEETAPFSYRFRNNALLWDGSFPLGVNLYAADGRLMRSLGQLTSGSYLFPTLPFGVYFIEVAANNNLHTYKAFSNGERLSIADQDAKWHSSQVLPQSDTLLFRRAGYFDRKIALQGRDTLMRVHLLKRENDDFHYFNELINEVAFEQASSLPSRSNDGEVSSVKIVYNTRDGLMYYQNTKHYPLHYSFAASILDFNQGNHIFNLTQYREHEERYLYPANLNYYSNQDRYVLQFISGY